jgi:hypothetical protein
LNECDTCDEVRTNSLVNRYLSSWWNVLDQLNFLLFIAVVCVRITWLVMLDSLDVPPLIPFRTFPADLGTAIASRLRGLPWHCPRQACTWADALTALCSVCGRE